jgi:hypothetical protein
MVCYSDHVIYKPVGPHFQRRFCFKKSKNAIALMNAVIIKNVWNEKKSLCPRSPTCTSSVVTSQEYGHTTSSSPHDVGNRVNAEPDFFMKFSLSALNALNKFLKKLLVSAEFTPSEPLE